MSQVGHQLVYELAKMDAKNIAKQQIKTGQFKSIIEKIPSSKNIHWEEKGVEFELYGQIYDVLNTELHNDTIIYYCINDTKENGLMTIYNQWIQSDKANDNQKNTAKLILKFASIECELPFELMMMQRSTLITTHAVSRTSNLSKRAMQVVSPPPQYFA